MSKPLKYRNVCEAVVANDLCIGCGICAGVCPTQVLGIQFNKYGEYKAVEVKAGCSECALCLRVCPFSNQAENEDILATRSFGNIVGIQQRPETGYYLDCFVGYSKVNRNRDCGSSGGLARWFLESLLESRYADYVVCVTKNSGPDKLFQFQVLNDVEAVRAVAKSAYYPVELLEVVQSILLTEGRYVIIGTPCFLKALRLAMLSNQTLRKRIVMLVGLVCGKMKSKFYAEYCCALGGGDPTHLVSADFRVKDPSYPANNFGFQAQWIERGNVALTRKVFFSELAEVAWPAYFTPTPCNYCDDIFAEVADVVFMDAWLPDYTNDRKGNSLVLCRSILARDLLTSGAQKGDLSVTSLDITAVIQSQKSVIRRKREELAHQLYLDTLPRNSRNYSLKKRVLPKRLPSIAWRISYALRERMRLESREVFSRNRSVQAVDSSLFVEKEIYKILERSRALVKTVSYKLPRLSKD